MTRDRGIHWVSPRRLAAVFAACAALVAFPGPGHASEASAWAVGSHSEARLLDGGIAPAGKTRWAGLEVKLAPRFITYWRDPGDAGVPPSFDFAGSTNLRSAEVRFPAPLAIEEAGTRAFGYTGDVVFPIAAEPLDPAQPIGLKIAVDYAACYNICLPARASLAIALDGRTSEEAGRVREAFAALPRRVAIGDATGPVSIDAVRPAPDGGLAVEASVAGGGGTLFVEAPEGWSYAARAPSPGPMGRETFAVSRLERPSGAARLPGSLTLTLVAPAGAIEVEAHLDGGAPMP